MFGLSCANLSRFAGLELQDRYLSASTLNMSGSVAQEFRVSVIAGIFVDKLLLAKDDAWALAVWLSNGRRYPFWSALFWSIPQLGSSQMLVSNYAMGEELAYGVVVDDGQLVSNLNPLLTEWLFCKNVIPSGSCLFLNLTSRRPFNGSERQAPGACFLHSEYTPLLLGPIFILLILTFLIINPSLYFSILFLACIYLASLISNLFLAHQSSDSWAGYTKDFEMSRMLILAPGSRWAVLSGPRNLIKQATVGSHIMQRPSWIAHLGELLVVLVVLSAALLAGSSMLHGMYLICFFGFLQIGSWKRAEIISQTPRICNAWISRSCMKSFGRRAELIEELSTSLMSDAWAYDSGLLTRRYLSAKSKAGCGREA